MRTPVLLVLAVAIAGCGGSGARHTSSPASTTSRTAATCRNSDEGTYASHNQVCVNGSLVRSPAQPTQLPLAKLTLPAAQPLPSGTTRIALPVPKTQWSPGIASMAAGEHAVWVAPDVLRLGPDGHPSRALGAPLSGVQDVAVGDGAVWASDYHASRVLRIDPRTRKVVATIPLPRDSNPVGIVTTAGAVWVANHHGGTLTRIDPRTNRAVATVVLTRPGAGGPQGVATGDGDVWVGVPSINMVFRVNPSTNQIAGVIATAISPCGGLAITRTAAWVSSCQDNSIVARIDPATNRVKVLLGLGNVLQPSVDGDTVWLVAGGDGSESPGPPGYLMQLGADDTVRHRFRLGRGFMSSGAAIAFGSVWVSDFASPRMLRVPLPR